MSTAHSLRHRRPVRTALATAVAVLGATLVLAPSTTAEALPTGGVQNGTASWGTSTYLASANFGRPNPYPAGYVAPATFDTTTRISTWGTATGTVAANGAATLQFDGTSVNFAKTSGHWLKLADVEAILDASGNGTVSALVSYGVAPGTYPPDIPYDDSATTRGPTRVDMVVLSGNTAADRTMSPTAATWTALDGAWAPAFVDFLDGDTGPEPDIAPFAYHTQVNANADRTPLPFTFSVGTAAPDVDAVVTETSYVDGVTIDVDGTGFRAVTNAGDSGVYVGLAPSGGLPDVSTPEGQEAFAASAWVPPAGIVNGALSVVLNAPTAELDDTESYSVYTWQAHTHSNTTQDTATPVTIDWEALEQHPSTVTPGGASSKVYGRTSVLTATVPGPGTVTLTGAGPAQTKPVSGNAVSFTVPASLAAGSHTATFAYSGGGAYLPAEATRGLTVTKATSKLTPTWETKPRSTSKGKLAIELRGPAGVPQPGGTVEVTLKRQGVTHLLTVTVTNGSGSIKVPKLAKGTWQMKLVYAGAANYLGDDDSTKVKIKR